MLRIISTILLLGSSLIFSELSATPCPRDFFEAEYAAAPADALALEEDDNNTVDPATLDVQTFQTLALAASREWNLTLSDAARYLLNGTITVEDISFKKVIAYRLTYLDSSFDLVIEDAF